MKAELKYLSSPDIEDLTTFQPKEEDCFNFLLQMFVGEMGKEGEEGFDITVCTPKWLLNNYKSDGIIFGIHHLIVFNYNYERIYSHLKTFIENLEGIDWDDLSVKIGAIGLWEFQDYKK